MKQSLWLLAIVAFWSQTALAVEKKPLPDFQVLSSQGHAFSSLQLAGRARSLIVILSPSDPLSDRLLAAFHGWPETRWISKTTFVVEGKTEEAQKYLAHQLPDQWQRVTWVSDDSQSARAALKAPGLPLLVGLDQLEMAWTVSGVLNDPQTLESIVRSWLK